MVWDMFEEMRRMQEEMDRLFAEFFGQSKPQLEQKAGKGTESQKGKELDYRSPVTDVYETEKSVVAAVELPGVDKKDIDLNVTDNGMEVKVTKKKEKEEKKKDSYSYGAMSRSFYRSFTFPTEVEAEKANAEYKNGVLRVEVPKQKKAKEKRKKIEIK
ncbi:MAG: Hsp20/alpha crystallin family protein [Candidatus Woesearchaeota archaeon]